MSEERPAEETAQSVRAHVRPGFVEPRWPVAVTVLTFIAITITLRVTVSEHESLGPSWLVPSVEIAMLVALLLADPTRIVSRRAWLRPVSLGLVVILAAAVFLSTFKLIRDLIEGGRVTDSATSLLAAGALVWLGNCLIFGLLYWLLDSGGPLARYREERPYPTSPSPSSSAPSWRRPAGGRSTSTI